MATREDVTLALDTVQLLNGLSERLRSVANYIMTRDKVRIDVIIADQAKKDKLIAGLAALSLDSAVLQSDLSDVVTICQYILTNVPEMIKL